MVTYLKGWFVLLLACVLSGGSCSTSDSAESKTSQPAGLAAGNVAGEPGESSPEGLSTWDATPQEPLTQSDIDAINQQIEKARQNYEKGNFKSFGKKFLANGKLLPPNAAAAVGTDKIQDFVRKSPKIDTLTFSNVTVNGAGDSANATVDVTMTGETYDENTKQWTPVSSTGTALILLKKLGQGQGNKWRARIVSYTSTS